MLILSRFSAALLLAVGATAFAPRGGTPSSVKQQAISSKWTMMPEEPQPEVSFLCRLPRVTTFLHFLTLSTHLK